jgi:N-acetylglutamate synthase-like GNAT family acetyltransferase
VGVTRHSCAVECGFRFANPPDALNQYRMTSALSIRSAASSERDALEALQWRASLNNPGDRDALLANPDAIVLPSEQIAAGQVFVAERDGTIVGFAAVLPRADGETDLDGLFVEPNIWRCGIGRTLVARCAEYAVASGATALYVIGNPHAAGFYAACGFEPIGVRGTRFGDGMLLRKQL